MVSVNVSFYNGTNKKNIYPTPGIGGVGLIQNLNKMLSHKFKKEKTIIVLIGKTFGHLEQSCFLKENYSIIDGNPPEINLINEKNNGEMVLKLIERKLVLSAHDISNGGLLIALSEMSMGSNLGIKIEKSKKLRDLKEYFFGEDQGRYVLEIDEKNLTSVEKILKSGSIYYEIIGKTQENFFEIENEMKIDTNVLYKANNQWYNNY